MEHSYYRLMSFVPLLFLLYSRSVATFGNTSDHLALVQFKRNITPDPLGVLSSWNNSAHFCNWTGVTCSKKHHHRVAFLELANQKLSGSISASMGNLTFLIEMDLNHNSFVGEIPEELGRLLHLRSLKLNSNSLEGTLPVNISRCLELRVLNLANNRLYGVIPNQLSSLNNLQVLSLGKNRFSGYIPPFIGNFSSLDFLNLGISRLKGIVPNELGQLYRLTEFIIEDNSLTGTIPTSLYNLSSITVFSIVNNQFEGHLPSDIGVTLPKLEVLFAGGNRFSGSIPTSLSNASGLRALDLGGNNFTGLIPNAFGTLRRLVIFNLEDNQLGSESGEANDLEFITNLINCTSLQFFIVSNNRLRGKLPESITSLSIQLTMLKIGGNLIQGSIPFGIENLVNLTKLSLERNTLSGSIPASIGNLKNLHALCLHTNNFSGTIPQPFGNLTNLVYLHMGGNILHGRIPPNLGKCHKLFQLDLFKNNLSGTITKEILSLPSLVYFDVSGNLLSGSPPLEVGRSSNLCRLEISDNRLSGKISSSLAQYQKLEYLYMSRNLFEGTIPESLSAIGQLRVIDLSHNNLSGEVPLFLANFRFLEKLNLSYNGFVGEVPRKGAFTNNSIVSLNGNDDICGGIPELHLPACPKETLKYGKRPSKSKLSRKSIALIVSGVSLLVAMLLLVVLYWGKKTVKRSSNGNEWPSSVSFSQLSKSTNCFSSDSLIGVGSFGFVYRGIMNDNVGTVAVKVLHLQQLGASKSFIAECRALRNIRHRNLVKIITVCSSVDFLGNNFKALIYEFMPNGSLEKWLHPTVDRLNKSRYVLNLMQRVNITIDVACALEYLHCHSGAPIVHCDLKPSNVLLDKDLTAHVGDFGLAKFLLRTDIDSSRDQSLSAGLKGTIGYIPPEYGMGAQVSILGDVYSYGILLLEMFTGKSPTNDMFQDGLSLHEFSKMALTERFMEVIDPLLFLPANTEDQRVVEPRERNVELPVFSRNIVQNKLQECTVEVVRIGLSCSTHSPTERLIMADVVKKLNKIRDLYLQS